MPPRLPALPKDGLKFRTEYQYIDLPQGMDRCTYLLRLDTPMVQQTNKQNADIMIASFAILETDTKKKVGSTVSVIFNLQGKGSLYFWDSFSPMVVSLYGDSYADETVRANFLPEGEAVYTECVTNRALVGNIARCDCYSYIKGEKSEDPGGEGWGREWYPATAEELAKYGTPAAS